MLRRACRAWPKSGSFSMRVVGKRPTTYGAWGLRVGDGAWLQQGRCCKVWCGGETRDGRVLWCYDGRERWCAGEGGRGEVRNTSMDPYSPSTASAEVQPLGLANRSPVSPQQTDTGSHDKPQDPMWPIWKLEPPTRLRASDGGKQGNNEDGPASRDRMERLLPDGPARPRRPARLLQPSKMQRSRSSNRTRVVAGGRRP